MKTFLNILTLTSLAMFTQAQQAFVNKGNLQIHTAANISAFGSFTNANTGALVNNGTFAVKGNVTNDQASMSAGTGTLHLNGTSAQTINGTQVFKTFDLNTD